MQIATAGLQASTDFRFHQTSSEIEVLSRKVRDLETAADRQSATTERIVHRLDMDAAHLLAQPRLMDGAVAWNRGWHTHNTTHNAHTYKVCAIAVCCMLEECNITTALHWCTVRMGHNHRVINT